MRLQSDSLKMRCQSDACIEESLWKSRREHFESQADLKQLLTTANLLAVGNAPQSPQS